MARFPFRSALVTGASSGIGDALVRLLAADGVDCVVVARRADRLEALASELSGGPGAPNIEVLAADLLSAEGVAAVAARISDTSRPIDLVVNNAGFGTSGSFRDLDIDRNVDEITLNIEALTRLSHAALGVMTARHRGWLLNVSSVASFQPGPGLAVYSATKAYVTSLSEALHEEQRSTGVIVTALCPGLTRTEFQSISNLEGFSDKYPAAAWLTSNEVAEGGLEDCARGKALSIPGVQYKAVAALTRPLPRWAVRRIMGASTSGRR